jgi:hypothetical protein
MLQWLIKMFYKYALPTLLAMTGTRVAARALSSTKGLNMIDKRACFGAGCYWGTEKFFKSDFGTKQYKGIGSVTKGKVGFMSADPRAKADPSYREVEVLSPSALSHVSPISTLITFYCLLSLASSCIVLNCRARWVRHRAT